MANRVLKHYQYYIKQLRREHPAYYKNNKAMFKDYLNTGRKWAS